ncbi:MAG: ribonuclease H-like domain-containing protein [Candidatus Paceibacterota bacterium]
MKKITFDIETSNIFTEVGSNNPADLDISVVCIHDSETDEYSSYTIEEFPKLWPILEKADMLIGFNSDHFDIPVLDKYYPGDLTAIKSLDILKEVKNSLGRRIKLDTIAEATLKKKKIGNGLEAITWWRNGEKEKVIKYCLEDVKITKQVYDYAREHNSLKYVDLGIKRSIKSFPLDTSSWEELHDTAMTHTLPF